MLKLTRPLVFIDLEGTGLDTAKDKIVSIAIKKFYPEESGMTPTCEYSGLINPCIPIPPESTAIHGITDDMVKTAPELHEIAQEIHHLIEGCDIAGYNHKNYDVPLLYEELSRCGIHWETNGLHMVDAGNIFKLKERRSLEAAMLFYCNKTLEGAHNALNDVAATVEVLAGQQSRYPDLADMTVAQLAEFSKMDDRLDLAGKVLKDKDGDACYGIRVKGRERVKVKDDIGFAHWMLRNDFPSQTHATLRKVLAEIESAGQGDMF